MSVPLVQIGAGRRVGTARQADGGGAEASRQARQARAAKWQRLTPRAAQVYVENRCHLRCAHCYESKASHPPSASPHAPLMTVRDYERLFDELADLGVLFLTLTGGELFLRPDAFEIIAAARARRFAVTLFTSGTLLNEEAADRLAALKPHDVHISVYSHLAAVHDGFTRVKGSHERSVRALRLLRERGVATVLKANLMTFNVGHVDGLIALAASVGADWQFDPTVKPRMDGDRRPLELALPPDTIRRLILSRPDLYTAFQSFAPGALCNGTASLLAGDGVLCGAARGLVSISADGGVYACGFFPVPGGHLRDGTLRDIWFGSAQLDAVRETTFDKMEACGGCDVKSTCGPCMAYAAVEHGDHRQCATSSRQLAEAVHGLARRKVHDDARMARGTQLPIVGDRDVPRPALKGGAAPLSTE